MADNVPQIVPKRRFLIVSVDSSVELPKVDFTLNINDAAGKPQPALFQVFSAESLGPALKSLDFNTRTRIRDSLCATQTSNIVQRMSRLGPIGNADQPGPSRGRSTQRGNDRDQSKGRSRTRKKEEVFVYDKTPDFIAAQKALDEAKDKKSKAVNELRKTYGLGPKAKIHRTSTTFKDADADGTLSKLFDDADKAMTALVAIKDAQKAAKAKATRKVTISTPRTEAAQNQMAANSSKDVSNAMK